SSRTASMVRGSRRQGAERTIRLPTTRRLRVGPRTDESRFRFFPIDPSSSCGLLSRLDLKGPGAVSRAFSFAAEIGPKRKGSGMESPPLLRGFPRAYSVSGTFFQVLSGL